MMGRPKEKRPPAEEAMNDTRTVADVIREWREANVQPTDWKDLESRIIYYITGLGPQPSSQPKQGESHTFEQWWATRTQEWIGTARNYPANFAHDVWNAALAARPQEQASQVGDLAHAIMEVFWPNGTTQTEDKVFDAQLAKVEKLLQASQLFEHQRHPGTAKEPE